MNNVNLPIETIRDGNKITKICVEDVTKMLNRIKHVMNISYSNMSSHMHNIDKRYKGASGPLIVGKGVSQPCFTDAFDEEIGNNIAFMKAKLNANIKKYNILCRIYDRNADFLKNLENEIIKIEDLMYMDIEGVRKYNPDYLIDKFPVYESEE
jgi:hypothetical protein